MPKAPRLALAISACLALSGCNNNPVRQDTVPGGGKKLSPMAILMGSGGDMAAMNRNVNGRAKAVERMGGAAPQDPKAETSLQGVGAPPKSSQPATIGAQEKASMRGALLKTSAAARGPDTVLTRDTTWLVYDDSAQGHVQRLREYAGTVKGRAFTGRDSLLCRWPYQPASPLVLFFHSRHAYADGASDWKEFHDDDGDGLLSESPAAKTVRIMKILVYRQGDTLWKTVAFTDHGQATHFDSLGAGKSRSWTDSTFVGGKVVAWQRVYDGDGDGFALAAAPGKAMRIRSDDYLDAGSGSSLFHYDEFGPGADGDFRKWQDNEQYPSRSVTIDALGRDVAETYYGDADGDGFFCDPAKPANVAWETRRFSALPGYKSYRDSAVQELGDPRDGSDDKIRFHSARAEYADGSQAGVATRALGGAAAYGENDTVEVSETFAFAAADAADPEGARDSLVRLSHLIPARLDSPLDDRVSWWSAKTYYRRGAASGLALRTETFAPAAPLALGAQAQAGSYAREDLYPGAQGGEPVRVAYVRNFDKAQGISGWRQTRQAASGDSTVETGAQGADGARSFAVNLDGKTRNAGWYNPVTREFRDTLAYAGAQGNDPARDVWSGTYRADGTGEYVRKQTRANGDTAVTRTVIAKEGTGFRATHFSARDTAVYAVRGDSTFWEKVSGGMRSSFTAARNRDGSHRITLAGKDEATSAAVVSGQADFSAAGAGSGSLATYQEGKAQPAVELRVDVNGDVYVNGSKLPPALTGA